MTPEKKRDVAYVLQAIADDAEVDVVVFDGQPFNGCTVAAYLANQGAAIRAVALAVKALYDEDQR